MGRLKTRNIDLGIYSKCFLCDYEIKNNKRALALHFKYSYPGEDMGNEKRNRLRCGVCKKENCLLH